jgi:hypothetical protein
MVGFRMLPYGATSNELVQSLGATALHELRGTTSAGAELMGREVFRSSNVRRSEIVKDRVGNIPVRKSGVSGETGRIVIVN